MTKVETIGRKRDKLLKDLSFLKDFYLAGGTALALQIEHRNSLDLDFYIQKKFDNQKLLQKLEKRFNNIKLIQNPTDTLIVEINDISVSFFHYPYSLIGPFVKLNGYPLLASSKDIAAMKLVAIIQKATKRDFIDIYFLIKKFGLGSIIKVAEKKYPSFNSYLLLQAITFFEDIGKHDTRRIFMIENVSWLEIKKYLIKAVDEFKNSL